MNSAEKTNAQADFLINKESSSPLSKLLFKIPFIPSKNNFPKIDPDSFVNPVTHTTVEIKDLHKTIKMQIESTEKQSKLITRLTWTAVFLGLVQVIGMLVQIWISFKQA